MDEYLESCRTQFWQKVFDAEPRYILPVLKGAKEVLSVGCGPAIIERRLVTGLDISREALSTAGDAIRTVVGSAENMNFEDSSFDAVIYVASLQFIGEYEKAIAETVRVSRPKGKLLAMLLNPESEFFKERTRNPDSYINKIKHTDLTEIEKTIEEYFSVKTEYFLGIKGTEIFQSRDFDVASLYVIKGIKPAK